MNVTSFVAKKTKEGTYKTGKCDTCDNNELLYKVTRANYVCLACVEELAKRLEGAE